MKQVNEKSKKLAKIATLITGILVIGISSWSAIQITTLEELQKIGRDSGYPLNEVYNLTQDINAEDTSGWNSGAGFIPIGNSGEPFVGTFNGNGHKISNLQIHRPGEDNVGLFGSVGSSGKVLNLKVENFLIVGGNRVGAVAGTNQGRIDSTCSVSGNLSGDQNVGGVSGYNSGTINSSYTNNYVFGSSYIGGLVGRNVGTIIQCYSKGAVVGTTNVGGLTGGNTYWLSSVRRCYSWASVSGISNVGGLVGTLPWGFVFESYSTGRVTGESNTGGLVGSKFFLTFAFISFWDKETSGWDSSSGGNGRTTAQMKQQSNYNYWSFNSIWGIINGITYPYFLWEYTVPNVMGLTPEEAETVLKNAGLVLGYTSERCSFTTPIGRIITQSPMPGLHIPPGSSVDIVISTGPCPSNIVPDVIGILLSTAIDEITYAGLTVGTVSEECSDTVPSGYVISQDPIGGALVSPETPVNLVVSSGPCPVTVPDLGGMTIESADSALLNAKLILGGTSEECSDTIPNGRIISQNPSAGSLAMPWSLVDVVVSSGSCNEGLPEGEGTTDGEGIPEGEGMTEGITEGINEGMIEGEGAIEGEGIVEGEGTIEGEGSPEGEGIPIPNVIGMFLSEAVITINNARLLVGIIIEVCTDEYPIGMIVGQEPIAGTRVEPNTLINLWVSMGSCPEGNPEGYPEGTLEGIHEGGDEGVIEGEGIVEGEGGIEGIIEGMIEGEGIAEGEGILEGEGLLEGEGEIILLIHTADQDGDRRISLYELLRVIQFFNSWGYYCMSNTEDAYAPGTSEENHYCITHSSDYAPRNWKIELNELLRLIQFFNAGGYHSCPGIEDNFCIGY